MVVSVLLEIRFGHAQISVPKIGLPTLKTAYTETADMLDKNDHSLITRILPNVILYLLTSFTLFILKANIRKNYFKTRFYVCFCFA